MAVNLSIPPIFLSFLLINSHNETHKKNIFIRRTLINKSLHFSSQYGLYSAFMGGFIYILLGTSKDVTLGPTAIMSLLSFSVVGGQPHRAVLLSLLCGLIQAVMALLRLGEEMPCWRHVKTL